MEFIPGAFSMCAGKSEPRDTCLNQTFSSSILEGTLVDQARFRFACIAFMLHDSVRLEQCDRLARLRRLTGIDQKFRLATHFSDQQQLFWSHILQQATGGGASVESLFETSLTTKGQKSTTESFLLNASRPMS